MSKPPAKRKLKDFFAPRDATETSRQGQGIGDIEAVRQMLTVPAGAARKVVQDAGTQQREAFGRMLSGAATQDDMTDMASDFMLPMAGTIGKAAKPAANAAVDALIKTYHASRSDVPFSKFQREYFGTGAGGNRMGPGVNSTTDPLERAMYLKTIAQGRPAEVLLEGGQRVSVPIEIATQIKNKELPLEDIASNAEKKLLALEGIKRKTYSSDLSNKLQSQRDLLESLKSIFAGNIQEVKRPGTLYDLGLDVSPEKLLNFDKDLIDQSAFVQDAIKSSMGIKPNLRNPKDLVAFGNLLNKGLRTPEVAGRLEDAGIQGVVGRPSQYAPGLEKALNYVTFDPERANILRATGILGMLTGAGAAGKASQTPSKDKPRRF